LKQEETEKTLPISEIIKQFIEAIKSIYAYSEDETMNEEIFEVVMHTEESIRAALGIKNTLDNVDDKKWDIVRNLIYKKVKSQITETDICDGDDSWYAILVPIKKGKYKLYVNYDWKSIAVESSKNEMPADVKKHINNTLSSVTGYFEDKAGGIWSAKGVLTYPGMEHIDESLYPYLLYNTYRKNPDEVADHICKIAKELEKLNI
jgi:hypothetical protein